MTDFPFEQPLSGRSSKAQDPAGDLIRQAHDLSSLLTFLAAIGIAVMVGLIFH